MKHANKYIKIHSSPLEVWLSKQRKGHVSKLSRYKEPRDINNLMLETWNGSMEWNIHINSPSEKYFWFTTEKGWLTS